MNRRPKLFVAILRITIGWLFFYEGIEALLDPNWSLKTFIQNPHSFTYFYTYLLNNPSMLLSLGYIVKGALVVIGAMLILGLFVRIASIVGIAIMAFFYFPLLAFPYVSGDSIMGSYYIIDSHIIYALVLIYMYFARAGEYFGLGTMFRISRY